jgi:hypothetical protein
VPRPPPQLPALNNTALQPTKALRHAAAFLALCCLAEQLGEEALLLGLVLLLLAAIVPTRLLRRVRALLGVPSGLLLLLLVWVATGWVAPCCVLLLLLLLGLRVAVRARWRCVVCWPCCLILLVILRVNRAHLQRSTQHTAHIQAPIQHRSTK